MYKKIKFKPKSVEEAKSEIDKAAIIYKNARTVFIADSDSLAIKDIDKIIEYTKLSFPDANRITSYARAKTLMKLGTDRLKMIKKAGLTRVHIGLESGDKKTLDFMQKGSTPEEIIKGGITAKEAELQLSFYILIGAGGKERLKNHAVETAKVCNKVNPDFIRLRTLVIQSGSLLEEKEISNEFKATSPIEKLREVKLFLENLNVSNCELASDHFTNYIWIDNAIIYGGIYGTLPRDKQEMLHIINKSLDYLDNTNEEIIDATVLYKRGLIHSL
jgi:radical SAM superfamily enzyme YgiQ (UPF0313 family)